MMQMPLLSYPRFSQFLQLQQEQQQLQQHYSRTFLPVVQGSGLGMMGHRSGTSCSEASTGSPTPSPSPPLSITSENCSSARNSQVLSKSGKSFTIDAILGIRDRDADRIGRDRGGVLPDGFRPRLGLRLSGSEVDVPGNYSNGVDVGTAHLDACGRRMDVSRLTAVSRDVLAFQLPTDLASASASGAAPVSNRRDLHQQASFQNSSCGRLSEKSASEVSKKCNGKSKRVRTIFTPEQLERLEAEFERQQYMVGPERLYLAHTLQLTEAQVKVWFQNRRIKWRKQHLEIQQQRLAAMKQQQQQHQHQRNDGEDSDDDSGDSNNFTFSTESNDNATTGGGGSGYFKASEGAANAVDSAALLPFQVGPEEEAAAVDLFRKSEPPSESMNTSSSSESA